MMLRAAALVCVLASIANAQPSQPAPATSEEETQPAPPAPPSAAPPVEQEPPKPRTPFDQGRFGFGAGAGSQSALGQRYFGIAASASYFVLDGVGVDLGAGFQWGNGPNIGRVTPGLRYVVQPLVGKFPLIPYVGAFYSHWFISGNTYADQDAVAGRAGLLYVSGSVVLGLGAVNEHIVSKCDMDCSIWYPDITIAIAF